uniref:Uncharacterized protein n=1 Tax=Arundo donax TaxID=35708 RepID=A0A0A8ZZ45_ARUDO
MDHLTHQSTYQPSHHILCCTFQTQNHETKSMHKKFYKLLVPLLRFNFGHLPIDP